MVKLGQTELVRNVNIRVFNGTDKVNSVGPCARVRVKPQLGLIDYTNLVGPILVISKTESWSSKLGGTDCISQWERNYCNR